MTDKLQKEYDEILVKVKKYNDEKKKFITKIQADGLTIAKGIIKEDGKVFGIFYTLDFYSHFDGHSSDPIYNHNSGAEEMTEEAFNGLMKIVKDYEVDKDETAASNALELLDFNVEDNFWEAYNFFDHFKIVDENHISWEYKGSNDQSELCDGSGVDFYLTTKSTIKGIKYVEITDRG